MGHHSGIVVLVCQFHRFEGLRQGSDLVYLHQNGACRPQFNPCRQTLLVGDKQIVSHQLYLPAQPPGQLLPAVPVVLRQGIFNGYDGEVLRQVLKIGNHLIRAADNLFSF